MCFQDTFDATARFIDALKIPYIGPSLGGVETLIEQVRLFSCRPSMLVVLINKSVYVPGTDEQVRLCSW